MPKYYIEHDQEAVCVYNWKTGQVAMMPKSIATRGAGHRISKDPNEIGFRYGQNGQFIDEGVTLSDYIVLPDVLEVLVGSKNYVVAAKDIVKYDPKKKRVELAANTPAADVVDAQAVTITNGIYKLHCFGAQAGNGDLYDLLYPSAQNTQQGLMQAPPPVQQSQFQQQIPQQIQQQLPDANLLYGGQVKASLNAVLGKSFQTRNGQWIQFSFEEITGNLSSSPKFQQLTDAEQHKILVLSLRYFSDLYQLNFAKAIRERGGFDPNKPETFADFFDTRKPMGELRQKIRAYSAFLSERYYAYRTSRAPTNIKRLAPLGDHMLFDGINGFIPGHYNPQTGEYLDGKYRFFDSKSATFYEFSQKEVNAQKQSYCGLQNYASNCFADATIQMLFFSPVLRLLLEKLDTTKMVKEPVMKFDRIITGRDKNNNPVYKIDYGGISYAHAPAKQCYDYPLVYYVARLVQSMKAESNAKKGASCWVSPQELVDEIRKRNPTLDNLPGLGADAKDLAFYLLEQLHAELRVTNAPSILPNINQYDARARFDYFDTYEFGSESSPVQSIFFGTNCTTNLCFGCGQTVYNVQKFNMQICNLGYDPGGLGEYRFYELVKQGWSQQAAKEFVDTHPCTMNDVCRYLGKNEVFTGENRNYCHTCKALHDSMYTNLIPLELLPTDLILYLNRGRGDPNNNNKAQWHDMLDAMPDAVCFTTPGVPDAEPRYYIQVSAVENGPGHFINESKDKDLCGLIKFNDAMLGVPGTSGGNNSDSNDSGVCSLNDFRRYLLRYQSVSKEVYDQFIAQAIQNPANQIRDQFGNIVGNKVKVETVQLPSMRFMLGTKQPVWNPQLGWMVQTVQTVPAPLLYNRRDPIISPAELDPTYKTAPLPFNQFNNQFNNQVKNFNNQQFNYQNNQNNFNGNWNNNQQFNYQNNQQFNNFQNNGNNFIKK